MAHYHVLTSAASGVEIRVEKAKLTISARNKINSEIKIGEEKLKSVATRRVVHENDKD